MPASLAALIFAAGILGLFLLDRDREARISHALWLPVVWLALGGSRNVSVWLSPTATVSAELYLEGSPLDRNILSALIVLGVLVLIARGQRTREILWRSIPLVVFFLYCAASVTWSDFPFVALKRLTKVIGNVVMVLIVLTEPDPVVSVKKFLTRTAFLLIPTSILLIKYYSEWGRAYDPWEGGVAYTGVAPDKNMLGAVCLISGLATLTRMFETFREAAQRTGRLLAIGTVLLMTLYLLYIARSATSLGCFLIGSSLITVLGLSRRPRPWVVHSIVASLLFVAFVAFTSPSARAFFIESAGRDSTLTGRTELWTDVLALGTRPWTGAGFETFFIGERLEVLWRKYWWHPNESHNGYLETYLTLGRIGLALLAVLMITGYRNAMNVYRNDPMSGSLRLAFLIIVPIYNLTEAAFKVMNPVWIVFLLVVTAPGDSRRQNHGQKNASPVPPGGVVPPALPVYGRLPAPVPTAAARRWGAYARQSDVGTFSRPSGRAPDRAVS
jgi:exopolysaccharide production protein ExoQ